MEGDSFTCYCIISNTGNNSFDHNYNIQLMNRIIVFGFTVLMGVIVYKFPHPMINPGELLEAHQDLNSECISCHAPFWGIDDNKCISCHTLADIGRDTSLTDSMQKNVLFHQALKNVACISCHTDHHGKIPREAISVFKHDLLSGTLIKNCISCHAQPSDDLHLSLSTDCNKCHTTTNWEKTIAFDHNLIISDKKENCNTCHAAPKDKLHSTLTESKCGTCHTSTAWTPATFDHDKYFILDRHHNVQCNTCHTNNDFTTYTCYGCHEHTASKMISEHREEGIYNITDCASCHKSGDEDDAKRSPSNQKKLNKKDTEDVKGYIESEEKNRKRKEKKDDDDD